VRDARQPRLEEFPVLMEDVAAVQDCISAWTGRASSLFATVSILKEDDLFILLYGLAHLGRGSHDRNAIAAFKELCTHTPGGLEHFLKVAEPYRETQVNAYYLYVWDADEMATLVETSSVANEYAWYVANLRSDTEARKLIEERNGIIASGDRTGETDGNPEEATSNGTVCEPLESPSAKGVDESDA
jgi:hypothetical protein